MHGFNFHFIVAKWFADKFGSPTAPQQEGWPAIQAGAHTLIAAPTGSGKTLAAFLASLDQLFRLGMEGALRDETYVVYVSPLKALSNDIHKNLDEPLTGIRHAIMAETGQDIEVRSAVRTGDTPASERVALAKRPPHILVTTPESLYLLLTSVSGRKMLSTVRTLIVDEIHAVVGNRRGSHLSLSMERLEALVGGARNFGDTRLEAALTGRRDTCPTLSAQPLTECPGRAWDISQGSSASNASATTPGNATKIRPLSVNTMRKVGRIAESLIWR